MKAKKLGGENLSIFFYLNKTRVDKSTGECPIFVRIRCDDGSKTVFSIKRSIHPNLWANGQPFGKTPAVNEIRKTIRGMITQLTNLYNLLSEKYPKVTAKILRNTYEGKCEESGLLLFGIFDEFISRQQQLVGIDVSQITVNRYKLVRNRLEACILYKYRQQKELQKLSGEELLALAGCIPLAQLDKPMVLNFLHFLKTQAMIENATTTKYLQRLKRFSTYSMDNNWLAADPFKGIKLSTKEVKREYLTEEELLRIMGKDFGLERLNVVRNMFIFCCFTGLAYIDSKNLTRQNIEQDPDGMYWIRIHRKKTDSRSNIPLLPIPLAIINKYADLDTLKPNEPVLPLASNVKMNA